VSGDGGDEEELSCPKHPEGMSDDCQDCWAILSQFVDSLEDSTASPDRVVPSGA